MKLHLAWVSPWNERSAIARFGREVLAALAARGHTVDVWRSEVGEATQLTALPTRNRVRSVPDTIEPDLWQEYDAVIVNLGDNFNFHGSSLPLLSDGKAIVILHDASLTNLCNGWAEQHADPTGFLQQLVAATYPAGKAYTSAGDGSDRKESHDDPTMVEFFAGEALGVIVHGSHYLDRAREYCAGPAVHLNLPYRDLNVPPGKPSQDGNFVVVTVGHINSNKRVDEVLFAFGASEKLRQRGRYRLIGPVEDSEKQRLLQVAAGCGAPAPEFAGWVTDDQLRASLAEADAICCLRYPVLEGGSASLVEAMLSARPVLVSDNGCYADVPGELVLKCKAGQEAEDVQRHLETLLRDPESGQEMARKARTYAQRTFNASRYAEDLLALIDTATVHQPAIVSGRALGRTLASFGVNADDPVVDRIGSMLADLFPSFRTLQSNKHHGRTRSH